MIQIASIVEGHGEVEALPILLRRLSEWKPPHVSIQALTPIRVRRDRFLNREDEFRKQLLLASAKCGDNGWILVVLDADDECPAELGQKICQRAQEYIRHRRLSVVIANREYEAWLIAAAHSINGQRGFTIQINELVVPEGPRDAKGWISERMRPGRYREVIDQPAFTALIDLDSAFDNSRSFRKLCREWQLHVQDRR